MEEHKLGSAAAWDLRKFFTDFPNLDLRTMVEREYRGANDEGLYATTNIKFEKGCLTIREVTRE